MAVRAETRKAATQSAQLALFEVFDPNKTNMVALYDLAPRFVFEGRDTGGVNKMVEREFMFIDKRYRITLKPTTVRDSSGAIVEAYLGEREQIVEEVIRRLASSRNRVTLHGENKVRFGFTIKEVLDELRRVKHTYAWNEIKEAITLLNEVRIRIELIDDRRNPLLSAPAFPVMGMRKGESGDGEDNETFVEFNPLVADAIRMLSFQQVSYDLLMEIRDPISRWLLKRLHTQISATGEQVHQMLATEIWQDSGMAEWKTTRNLLRRVVRSVDVLRGKGILAEIDAADQKSGQKKEDVLFTLVASDSFMAEVRASRLRAEDNVAEFRRVTNGRDPVKEFVPLPGVEVYQLRRRLQQKRTPGTTAIAS